MSKEFLKICFDQQAFVMQKYGGVSRYFADLIFNLQEDQNLKLILPFKFHQNAYLKKKEIGISNKFINKFKLYYLDRVLKSQKIYERCDIHHGTYYYGIPKKRKFSKTKVVSTLHDMTPEKLKDYFGVLNPHRNKLDWFDNSDLIISVSESSKNDLLNLIPKLENKIKTVHLYSSFSKSSPSLKPSLEFFNNQETRPYFLYIGGREGYKNVKMLFNAFKKFKEMNGIETLIFAGSKSFTYEESKLIEDYEIQKYIFNIQVDDSELWYLYQNCSAILVPSLAEGFSLPLVEGLVADVPIITSNISVHKEVSSSFAYNIDPNNCDEWVDLMLLKSKLKPSQRLNEKYNELLDYFSIDRLAKVTLNLYKSLF